MLVLIVSLISGLLFGQKSVSFDEFQRFVQAYNKSYQPGSLEYYKRLTIFQESVNRIKWLNDHRKHPESAFYGITQYSDLTPYEFEQKVIKKVLKNDKNKEIKNYNRFRRSLFDYKDLKTKLKNVSDHFDWREKKVVGEVSNQGKCGACWAYSTVETIESMVALKTNKLEEYSVQQLVDCAKEDNQGCDGGDTCSVLVWMAETKTKLQTAKKYPMRDDAGECRIKNPNEGILIASNFTCDNFTNKEEEIVKLLANHGPLVAAVDAASWQDYLGGIIQYHCNDNLNHAVQIVGYDLRGDIPYYIVRNTWGKSYGIDGYIHIAIGKNLCGIAEEISAVDVII